MNVVNKKYFYELTPDEGYVLTDWDKNDIIDYSSYKIVVCPLITPIENFYEITVEEDYYNLRLQELEIQKREFKKGAE